MRGKRISVIVIYFILFLTFYNIPIFAGGAVENLALTHIKGKKFVVLKAATNNPKTSGHYRGLQIFKRYVEERTNGEVRVELYSDAVLGDEEQMIERMQIGTVDIMMAASAKYANFVPEMDIYSPPYTFKNWAHYKAVADSPIEEKLQRVVMERTGDYYLGLFTDGVRNIFSRKPIRTLSELKGIKLRTMTGPNETHSFRALGTNPIPMAYTELYAALKSGFVEAAENTMTSILGMKFYESCKYILRTEHNFLALPFFISRKAIDKVPVPHKETVLKAGRDTVKEQIDLAIRMDQENEEILKKQFGIIIFELSREDKEKAIELCLPVQDENAKRIKMELELILIRELAKKY